MRSAHAVCHGGPVARHWNRMIGSELFLSFARRRRPLPPRPHRSRGAGPFAAHPGLRAVLPALGPLGLLVRVGRRPDHRAQGRGDERRGQSGRPLAARVGDHHGDIGQDRPGHQRHDGQGPFDVPQGGREDHRHRADRHRDDVPPLPAAHILGEPGPGPGDPEHLAAVAVLSPHHFHHPPVSDSPGPRPRPRPAKQGRRDTSNGTPRSRGRRDRVTFLPAAMTPPGTRGCRHATGDGPADTGVKLTSTPTRRQPWAGCGRSSWGSCWE
ncbi:hypothetical protein SGPA1_31571 [Streptomyces misionensis JCM 4497]